MKQTVVCDIDGTILDLTGIRAWALGLRDDYHVFHELALEAPPIDWVITELTDHWDLGLYVALITARSGKFWQPTVEWLTKNNVPYDRLMMRDPHDLRCDYDVKKDLLDELLSTGYNVVKAYDDNPNTVKLWEEAQIPYTLIPGWDDK